MSRLYCPYDIFGSSHNDIILFAAGGSSSSSPSGGDQQDVMNCATNLTANVELGSQGTAVFWEDPWVTSPTGNTTLIAQTHTSGNLFPVGTTTVTYIFGDVYRPLVTCSFNVIGTVSKCHFVLGLCLSYTKY